MPAIRRRAKTEERRLDLGICPDNQEVEKTAPLI